MVLGLIVLLIPASSVRFPKMAKDFSADIRLKLHTPFKNQPSTGWADVKGAGSYSRTRHECECGSSKQRNRTVA